MQDKSLAESIRSRLARGLDTWLAEIDGARLITVHVQKADLMTDLIFAIGTQAGSERPWRYEITDRGRSTKFATIDDVLAYLATSAGTLELRS